MSDSWLESYCASDTIWDTPNAQNPNTTIYFPTCLQHTLVAWLPTAVIFFAFPFTIMFQNRLEYKKLTIPRDKENSILYLSKLVLSSLGVVLQIVGLILRIATDSESLYTAEYVTPALYMVAIITSILIELRMHKTNQKRAGSNWLFWLLMTASSAFLLIILAFNDKSEYNISSQTTLIVSYLFFGLNLLTFILNWFREPTTIPEKTNPEHYVSWPNVLLFSWFTPLVRLGHKKPLDETDLWNLNEHDGANFVGLKFDENYQNSKTLTGALVKTYFPQFITACFFKLVNDFLQFVPIFLLYKIINFIDSQDPIWFGYIYAAGMYGCSVIVTLCLHQYFHRVFRVGMLLRSGLISKIYAKALKLSSASFAKTSVGEMVTLMSTDAQRLMDTVTYLAQLWSSPLQIILCLLMLCSNYLLGWKAALSGFATSIIMIPANIIVSKYLREITISNMKNRTTRIKKTNELLNGMKVIKLYAWEESFRNGIFNLRENELKTLWKTGKLNAFFSLLWGCAPFFVSCVSFAVYAYTGTEENPHVLTSSRVFASISVFNVLRFPLNMLPALIVSLVQAKVTVNRLSDFLNLGEINLDSVKRDDSKKSDENGNAVIFEKASFTWGVTEKDGGVENTALKTDEKDIELEDTKVSSDFKLDNLNLKIKEGELVAIIGAVGAGKSSLVQSMIGDLEKLSGSCEVYGKLAYVPQQAWIMNKTVKENIVFGSELNEKKYKNTIQACALEPDFKMLPGGDQTEIGEKGINLSGGQKQRVALARAVYSTSNTFIFDDPLSAVDAHVGKHIFQEVMSNVDGILKKSTRILVTNAMQYVSSCDKVVIVDDGKIVASGSYTELKKDEKANVYLVKFGVDDTYEDNKKEDTETEKLTAEGTPNFNKQVSKNVEATDAQKAFNKQKSHQTAAETKAGALTNKEEVETGNISIGVFLKYAKSIGGFNFFIMIATNIIYVGANTMSKTWLSVWANASDTASANGEILTDAENGFYIGIYGGIGVTQCIFVLLRTLSLAYGCLCASRKLHSSLLNNIVRVPMAFFDTTPLGRIVNRFSKDIAIVDDVLPRSFSFWFSGLFEVIATIVICTYATWQFICVVIPLLVVYFFVQRYYVATSRQLKRIEGTTRSPIYSHFGESISGVSTIRAFSRASAFIETNEHNIDRNQICYYPNVTSNRWLAVRLEIVANTMVAAASIFATLSRDSLDAAIAGLSISYAMSITQTLNWWVRQTSEIETNIVAVERIMNYSKVPQEAPATATDSNKLTKLSEKWPTTGKVTFKNYSTRYREGLDLVVKNINVTINPGEKVGIVGRTGAGKSSLTLALFRIIESAEGEIQIDDQNVSEIGLNDLRGRLTIIPQDPILWTGSLRHNLDPLSTHSDDSLWAVLEQSHLKEFFMKQDKGLSFVVQEGGENLSIGQKQLVCLARALLRESKILVLDEATAAVDPATDNLIQKTIRKQFSDWTILAIAHRLNTIIDYDKILVLDKGEVVEFDTPETLLKNKDGIFTSLCQQAGMTM